MRIAQSLALVAMFVFAGAAHAQQSAAPAAPAAEPAAPAATATPKANPPRSAKSLECSKQADAQKLHGKPRKTFMSTCKKG